MHLKSTHKEMLAGTLLLVACGGRPEPEKDGTTPAPGGSRAPLANLSDGPAVFEVGKAVRERPSDSPLSTVMVPIRNASTSVQCLEPFVDVSFGASADGASTQPSLEVLSHRFGADPQGLIRPCFEPGESGMMWGFVPQDLVDVSVMKWQDRRMAYAVAPDAFRDLFRHVKSEGRRSRSDFGEVLDITIRNTGHESLKMREGVRYLYRSSSGQPLFAGIALASDVPNRGMQEHALPPGLDFRLKEEVFSSVSDPGATVEIFPCPPFLLR